jgi:hypothetical protein
MINVYQQPHIMSFYLPCCYQDINLTKCLEILQTNTLNKRAQKTREETTNDDEGVAVIQVILFGHTIN